MAATPVFPKPRIPIKPVLSLRSFGTHRSQIPAIDDFGVARYVTSGRAAIALALQNLGVKPGDEVLIPAFHCTSMVEPAVWLGAKPVFYKILSSTEIDFDDIKKKITPQTRAMLATHYFGFSQPVAQLRSFCDQYRIALIEDCAHAYFGKQDGRPLGSFGDFAIASSMKFFPIYDGGVLVSARRSLATIQLEPAAMIFSIKALINGIEQSLEYGRFSMLRPIIKWPLVIKDWIWSALKRSRGTEEAEALGPSASDGAYEFDARWLNKQQSTSSRRLMRWVDTRRIVEKRRENYLRIHEQLSNTAGGAPLFHDLADEVVPYVYPFIVDQPERVFAPMKVAGIPILRFGEFLWEGVDERVCPVSANLSRRVFQFPCHQELKEGELEWMLTRIREILKESRA